MRIKIYKKLSHFSLDVALQIQKGEFIAIRGKSGSGKTTLLRCIAGLERARGLIEVDGAKWLEDSKAVPPQKREVGFVFQEYALFPNMSVLQNLLYVKKDLDFALHLLKLVDLLDKKDSYPHQLSGGQQQRVALARAYMRRPKVMLLDEPLSSLDPATRSYLQTKIKELHQEFGATTLMVSHDVAEIFRLSDRVVELQEGKIVQEYTAPQLLNRHQMHKAEVVAVQENEILVAFLGDIFKLPKTKEHKVGDIVTISIKEIACIK